MFPNTSSSGLSFSKVLSGISKTLNVANQVIPLYKQAKPMINNAKNILSVLKDINVKSPKQTNSSYSQSKSDLINKKTEYSSSYHRPVFFK